MSSLAAVRLVAGREISHRIRSRGFIVLTVLLCAAVVGTGILNSVLGDDGPPSFDLATVGAPAGGFQTAVAAVGSPLGVEVELSELADRAEGEVALDEGTVDAVVDLATAEVVWRSVRPAQLDVLVQSAWRATRSQAVAEQAGLSEGQIAAVLSPEPLQAVVLERGDDSDGLGAVVGLASAILLFISVSAFGAYVSNGVVEEKATAVVEVLLSHVRPAQLLAGKVFGIGVVALVQFSAAVVAGVVALRISGSTVPAEVWIALPATVLWFIAGFLLYATLFAVAGSFASRVEDAQGAAAPITAILLAAYAVVFTLGSDPGSVPSRVLSVLPPFAPLLMPLRMATGSASVLEIALAAVLLVVAVVSLLRLAGVIYARTVLHRGSRLHWGEALRAGPAATVPQ